jgi:hypothetical protein
MYNDTTINFTVTFSNPYLYGLLNKKTDNLVVYLKATADPSMILYNTTANCMGNNKTTWKITMQFDYRNEKMSSMRDAVSYLYYVMILIIAVQFFALFFR